MWSNIFRFDKLCKSVYTILDRLGFRNCNCLKNTEDCIFTFSYHKNGKFYPVREKKSGSYWVVLFWEIEMTEQELRKLGRRELLEILLEQSKEVDRLQAALASAQEQLDNREIVLNEAGSIAEASLKLNGIFEVAQNAANQYLENIEKLADVRKRFVLNWRKSVRCRQKSCCQKR